MKRIRKLGDRASYQGGFLSIGNFDGVHCGHQAILRQLVQRAHAQSVPAVVMTFEPHPISLLKPEHTPPRLTDPDTKAQLLGEAGVDVVFEYPTDWALLKLTPDEFFEQLVLNEFDAKGLVEGPNFFFGQRRAGNVETLRELCHRHGRAIDVVQPTELNGVIVSSSLVRQALSRGEVRNAAQLLGRTYRVTGIVQRGAERGRTLGFPTANLGEIPTLLPGEGVYAGRCCTPTGSYLSAVHLGPNPTFADEQRKVEIHLLDFSGDLYGERLSLEFLDFIRPLTRFDSAAELVAQIHRDVAAVRQRNVSRGCP
ncbi:bifunctional riboflavin kinase/FAD synthetase [Planctomicrobium sp. SH664]|uniref:bifunctional riboflavin kinase/FAD synthetase n=1 Tax=Planctomicrobium sp. SH664 TaxID=3448125 RepID=UPI003F5AEA41